MTSRASPLCHRGVRFREQLAHLRANGFRDEVTEALLPARAGLSLSVSDLDEARNDLWAAPCCKEQIHATFYVTVAHLGRVAISAIAACELEITIRIGCIR